SFNVLVLDEPTNDLDIETLDLLEELLLEYAGTLLVVSHDREFLDHVVTSTLVLEGKGRVGEYVGGYSDWVRQRVAAVDSAKRAAPAQASVSKSASAPVVRGEKKRRITFKETTELASLPEAIDALERERESIFASLAEPALLRDGAATTAAKARVIAIDTEIARRLARWEELETIAVES
ncbi:MAG: ABC transporter ATP-binding protein, partial [bacterium]